jgi:hypothetical protein
VHIEAVPMQWLARIQYYDSHLDDSVRFAFRIGFWGLIFAIFSIALLIASLLVSVLSFVRPS